ncbi:universal stress protein [Chryseosolibacter indicus]|uniref:Universal stress protein n=1 Tax=Chryseosolibacter indicus TaxID=2782351 RepID=A0ABS5VV97_9BACT|nr:universal stress protein [Chryseosolibacter indicus]MBT1704978.1 universal stress protein [Chryseosolibacter indicus]
MVNILVPTDFSELSRIAAQYAIRIANKLDGNVTLLHAIEMQDTVRSTIARKNNSRHILRTAKENFETFLQEVDKHVKAKTAVRCRISRAGSFNEIVKKNSKRLRTGLIVMGTKGAGGLKKAILGSNTTTVIDNSHVPVLAVPEKAHFKAFRNVIYATDLKHIERELEILIPYVERFGSIVHVLHVMKNGRDITSVEERIEKAVTNTGYKNIVTIVTVDTDIDGAIQQYIDVSKADLLAMFTHQTTFYEKLFDRSITRKMAFHSTIPLLAFKQ